MIRRTKTRSRLGAPLRAACSLLALATGCKLEWSPLYHEEADMEALRTVAIAPLDEALTFARTTDGEDPQLLAVVAYEGDLVHAVDLSTRLGYEDPITAFLALGYDAIEGEIDDAVMNDEVLTFAASDLGIPVDLGSHHIAAGTNFPEHADEAGVTEGPYLFPKLVEPTAFDAPVSLSEGEGLLDYEVELGFVPLVPIEVGDTPEFMGLVLCNDYTDRDTLLRLVDTSDVESGDGFTTGKSFPGYLPVGNLFVIPRDVRAFAAALQLELYVNGWLRQRELVSSAIWDVDALIEQTWVRRSTTWAHRGERVGLVAGDPDVIPARALLMTGTPAGVVFNELNLEQKFSGLFDWLFGGQGDSVPDHAIDNYIRDARAAGIYLHEGDDVFIHVDGMGIVRNEVVP
jgi:2,4-diketo-3-deoxy-L-fuconate hydrolase